VSEELRIDAAQPIKSSSCSFGLVTQPFELTARPADDIEIDPLQGWTQLRPIEVAVVVERALNVRILHLGQFLEGLVAATRSLRDRVSVEADQVFGLLLQIGKIRPLGRFIETPVHQIAVDRKTGCTKPQMLFDRCKWSLTLPAGPGATCAAEVKSYRRRLIVEFPKIGCYSSVGR